MIAIIAILAAILFPVFAKVREKARQTSCACNLRQIGLANMQYNQDNDEVLYPHCFNALRRQLTLNGGMRLYKSEKVHISRALLTLERRDVMSAIALRLRLSLNKPAMQFFNDALQKMIWAALVIYWLQHIAK